MSEAFRTCPCIFLLCALSLFYSPFLLYCCVLRAIRVTHQLGNFRKDFHTLHKHFSRCRFLLKPKPNQPKPSNNTVFLHSPWCMVDACPTLPMCLQDSIVGLDARHFSSQKNLKLSLTVEHISHQCIIASLCIFAWVLLNVILHVRKLLDCRAVAVLASFFFSVLMRDWIYYSNEITGSLLASFPTDSAVYSVA